MKRAAMAVVSTLVAALMICTVASAVPSTVVFEDPLGDIGPDPFYNLPSDPVSQSTMSSRICQATYLDIVKGWVTEKNPREFIMGLELAGPVDEGLELPPGATGVLWVWYFYGELEYYADCVAVVSWDGEGFRAYFKDKSEMGVLPYPYWEMDFEPSGSVVELKVTSEQAEVMELLMSMNWWFAETKIWFTSLVEPYDDWALPPNIGGWFPVDINDWDPAETELPWLPMPS